MAVDERSEINVSIPQGTFPRQPIFCRFHPLNLDLLLSRPGKTTIDAFLLMHAWELTMPIGNESLPKIVINGTINLFLKTAVSILPISNHNSFRVLFDKTASVYFIRKIYLHFSTGNGQRRKPALCQLYRHTFVPYACRRGRSTRSWSTRWIPASSAARRQRQRSRRSNAARKSRLSSA